MKPALELRDTVAKSTLVSVRNEDLRVGDVISWWCWGGAVMITQIKPYTGHLSDIIFAVAETRPGFGFSLERGGYSERYEVKP